MGPGHCPANCSTNSNPVSHTECRPVRAPAQGGQREEQETPPPRGKRQKTQKGGNPHPTTNACSPEKKGGARDSHTTAKPRNHCTRGRQPAQPNNTKGDTHEAPQKNIGGQPCPTQKHPAKSSGPPRQHNRRRAGGKDTLNTPAHTPTEKWRANGKNEKAIQTKGEGWKVTKEPRTGTGVGKHHKATTRQGQEPHTFPAAGKKMKEWGGETQPTAAPAQPHTTGSPTRGGRETDGTHARGHTPEHPNK